MVKQSQQLDRTFHALSDPTRRRMIDRLTRGEATVTELAEPFEMSLPAVLKHVTILADAGLVACEKRGRTRRCRLDTRALDRAVTWVERRRAAWEQRFDELQAHLAEER